MFEDCDKVVVIYGTDSQTGEGDFIWSICCSKTLIETCSGSISTQKEEPRNELDIQAKIVQEVLLICQEKRSLLVVDLACRQIFVLIDSVTSELLE